MTDRNASIVGSLSIALSGAVLGAAFAFPVSGSRMEAYIYGGLAGAIVCGSASAFAFWQGLRLKSRAPVVLGLVGLGLCVFLAFPFLAQAGLILLDRFFFAKD